MTETAFQSRIKFYMTGYAGKDINDLKPLIGALDAVMIDVRFSPTNELMRCR